MADLNTFGFSQADKFQDDSVREKLDRENPLKVRPKTFGPILDVMADGRWWTRPALRAALAGVWGYDQVKSKLIRVWRRDYVARRLNPTFSGQTTQDQMTGAGRGKHCGVTGGNVTARYVYRITATGLVIAERWRAELRKSRQDGSRR